MQLRVKSTIVVHMVPVAHRFRRQSSFGTPAPRLRLDGEVNVKTDTAANFANVVPMTRFAAILSQRKNAMVTIDLRRTEPEDIKLIRELRSMGCSEELIQLGYDRTVQKREEADNEQRLFD